MANLAYFKQMADVRVWRNLSEDTLQNDLMNLHGFRLNLRSRNLKIRLIEARLTCRYGVCLLSYDELKQMVVDGVALPKQLSVAA